jgi:hypothetical protein
MGKTLDEKLYALYKSYGIPVTITVHKDTWTIKQVGKTDTEKNLETMEKEHGCRICKVKRYPASSFTKGQNKRHFNTCDCQKSQK